jgi:hypothetical protein
MFALLRRILQARRPFVSQESLAMPAQIVARDQDTVTLQIEVPLSRSMLETEAAIQQTLNEAGVLATQAALEHFDTDGSPLQMGDTLWYSKGQQPCTYQTPYGEAVVARHVYQTAAGGATFCPLERDARILLTSTPRFAQQVSNKYAEMAGGRVVADLARNHGRAVSLAFVQDLAAVVASVVQAKEESWHYATPKLNAVVRTVGIGVDGTCILQVEEGGRQVMVGTLSLYDGQGERLHTIYLAAPPEYGKEQFFRRLDREVAHVKSLYPHARYTAVADGAADHWPYLQQQTTSQCVDFQHAVGYVQRAAKAAYPRNLAQRQEWVEQWCHRLKHEVGAARRLLTELRQVQAAGVVQAYQEDLEAALTYFDNHQHQMPYAERLAAHLPIGSGVTEAACKTLVKMRLCRSGAKWKTRGAGVVLSLRALVYSADRWEQFWAKVEQYGFPIEMAA